jgi:hypothetical protein
MDAQTENSLRQELIDILMYYRAEVLIETMDPSGRQVTILIQMISLTFSTPNSIIAADGAMDQVDLKPQAGRDPIFRAAEIWLQLSTAYSRYVYVNDMLQKVM